VLHLGDEQPGADASVLKIDAETTGMSEELRVKSEEFATAQWYDLQGRKVANGQKPTAKGLYIVNGKKVVK
jgi:hypothetical protein